jgi:hypothetical protein
MLIPSATQTPSFHINSNTTTNISQLDMFVSTLLVAVSGSPTSWTIKIQTREATPKVIYSKTFSAAQALPDVVLALPFPAKFVSGLDIVTSGTTPGIADVWVSYSSQLQVLFGSLP